MTDTTSATDRLQAAILAIASDKETHEELLFNPETGELEAVGPTNRPSKTPKPVMTMIAKVGFF